MTEAKRFNYKNQDVEIELVPGGKNSMYLWIGAHNRIGSQWITTVSSGPLIRMAKAILKEARRFGVKP